MVLALVQTQLPSPPFTPALSTHFFPSSCSHLLFLIKNCKSIPQLKQIHAQFLKTSFPLSSTLSYDSLYLYSRIIDFSASKDLDYTSRLVFAIQNPNSFIWNTLMKAYAKSSDHKSQCILLYCKMLSEGLVAADKYTFPLVLKTCAFLFALSEGTQIHGQILKLGFGLDTHVNNSLIHFYASCGCLDLARRVFDEIGQRSEVSWNVMIDGYVNVGEFDVALKLFKEMQEHGYEPDKFTIQSMVSACAGLGALSLGLWCHAFVLRECSGDVVNDVLMNNSLLDMYSKCGSLDLACQLFQNMRGRDVTSWNTMILGFAMHGHAEEALSAFVRMSTMERLKPTSITFVGVLSACNHGGLVNEGRKYFDLMVSEYGIEPRIEHYGCFVDLLARAGFIEEALDIVCAMPIKPDAVIWRSLLDACCKRNASIEVSKLLAKRIIESKDGNSSGVYVLLSRVYASANRWDDVGTIRKLMNEQGISKVPGCSLIEGDGVVHQFLAGDTTHPQSNEIYEVLEEIEEILKSDGYIPDSCQAPLVDESNSGMEQSLRLHSERLAIAFGLLNARPGVPIRVLKNLRVCIDCHTVTKLISRLFDVEIMVRDRTRFHRFKDGSCSCMDYW